jgi:hypothetical protein
MIIEAKDGQRTYRITLPRVTASDLGDIQFTRTGAANLPVTVTALPGADGRSASICGVDAGAVNSASGATAGTPGTWTPGGSTPPASVAALQAGTPNAITASPATSWTTGQYVQTGTAGAPGEAHWDGDSWEAGRKA